MKHVSSSVLSLEQRHGPVSRRVSVACIDNDGTVARGISTSRCPVVCPVVPSLFRPTVARSTRQTVSSSQSTRHTASSSHGQLVTIQ